MTPQTFDGTYEVSVFIPENGSYRTTHETMVIKTASEGLDDLLQPESHFTLFGYQFQLSGRINAMTGLATISGQALDAGVTLPPSLWSFVATPALHSVSASRVLFDGAAAIGFYFSLFGMREKEEMFENQSLPAAFLKQFHAASTPAPKL